MVKELQNQEVAVNVNLDTTPILYTDTVFITVNDDGVVFDIGQKIVATPQTRIVSRVGMSREHAKKFLKELNRLLAVAEPQLRGGSVEN